MSNITSLFNGHLKPHGTHCTLHPQTQSSTADEFLKDAYRIASHVSALRKQLLSIRQAYLSTATAPPHYSSTFRKQHPYSDPVHLSKLSNNASEQLYLTNTDRDAIDSNSKLLLRDLSSSLRALADAETLRHRTWQRIHDRKYRKSGLGGLLGRWAAGDADDNDGDEGKSAAQIAQEGKEETLSGFREGVLWYLGRKLESVVETQREMVERRVKREVERGRSVLYMAKTQGGLDANLSGATTNGNMDSFDSPELSLRAGSRPNEKQGKKAQMLEEEEKQNRQAIETQLSPEQLQLFAQENNDMLRHYEDTLDQVRTAEKSILEISALQTQLVENLDLQSTHISQLVTDSVSTAMNVGGGNKQLKRAAERRSTARLVFWASCGLCGVLVGWDLIF